ncbi:High mobility group B protein 4 [Apostasia shenzhenica]|uniref:High mobility group B protein 4 n=1 Tax=Apostasia shenzhenica TaxID=1088818 RepID=A0A2I0BDE4_9ASPA|nr:High mobility group B protein 4 [Apostasia shenzhenica]
MKGGRSKAADSKKADGRLATKKAVEKPKRPARGPKDPNKPKRPPSAFFVGKAGGDRWKSMSDADKAPYVAKADKLKSEYLKKMRSYNEQGGKTKNAAEDESSEKSKSEVSEGAGSDGEEGEDDG